MSLLAVAGANSSVGGYEIDNSLKLEADNSESIYKNNSNGNRKTFTSSLWVKLSELSNAQILVHGVVSNATRLFTNSNEIYIDLADNTSTYYRWRTNALFRDSSAWYHFVWRVDTTDSTAANRMRFYINGEEYTDWQESATVPQNFDTLANYVHGSTSDDVQFSYKEASLYNSLYLAEVHHVDGQSLAPTEFGEFDEDSGIWKPIEYTGTYGTNGFYLDFEDSSNLGNDANGGTDFTLSNISAADQATDTPTNNFCTLNPLQGYNPANNEYFLYTEGNTRMKNTLSNVRGSASTISVNKGKWYAEWKYTAGTSLQLFVGILAQDKLANEVYQNGYSAATTCTWYPKQQLSYYRNNGTLVTASATRNSTIAAGDVIGMFLDMDNNHLYFQKNGSDINVGEVDASTLLFKESNLFDCNDQYVCFYANVYDSLNEITWNFGGLNLTGETTSYSDANNYGNFKYEPVRGSDNYYSLCSKNLAEYG